MSNEWIHDAGAEAERLGEKLKEARIYLGLTQEVVASELLIPRPAISQIERGIRRVSSTELKRLSVLYGRSLEWFLTEEATSMEEDSAESMALFRAVKGLNESDMREVRNFAEFLRTRPPDSIEQ